MFRRTENFNEALQQFTRLIAMIPEDFTVYIQRGLVY
jgi:tetratricopeptide (TPR) repeat protein